MPQPQTTRSPSKETKAVFMLGSHRHDDDKHPFVIYTSEIVDIKYSPSKKSTFIIYQTINSKFERIMQKFWVKDSLANVMAKIQSL